MEINYEKDNELYYITKRGDYHRVCCGFKPTQIYYPLDEDDGFSQVEFERFDGKGNSTLFRLSIDAISNEQFLTKELFRHKIVFKKYDNEFINSYVIDRIQKLQQANKITYITSKLGWQYVPSIKQIDFIMKSKCISSENRIEFSDSNMDFYFGCKEKQLEFIRENILSFKETRFALILGLSSIVSSYIEPYTSIGTLVVNICGESSTGKSTIAELIASLFANPKTSNYGIVRTFNATKNFILGMSEGRNGIPIILDDANANANEHNKSDLIYQFALGEARGRCNSSGELQDRREGWSGIALITSEYAILDAENMCQGAQVRTLTINDMIWTQSAEHSDLIKREVRKNYGYICEDIAEAVKKIGIDELLKYHDWYSQKILDKMTYKDNLSNRMATKLSPIAITAELVKKYFNDNRIDIDEIIDLLVKYEQRGFASKTTWDKAYDFIQNYIYINKQSFERIIYDSSGYIITSYHPRGKLFGKIIKRGDNRQEVLFPSSVLQKLFKDEGFLEKNTILKNWFTQGRICKQSDRFVFKANSEMDCSYYKIIIDCLEVEERKILSPVDSVQVMNTETPICQTEYDDSNAIEEIFRGN